MIYKLYKKPVIRVSAATESAGINDVVSDVIRLVRMSRCVPRVKEEAAITLTMLLLSDPTSSTVIDMCQAIVPLLSDKSPKVNQSGVELCAAIGSILPPNELEPLQRALNTYDIQQQGTNSLTGEIYARIARKRPPTLDATGAVIYGERGR